MTHNVAINDTEIFTPTLVNAATLIVARNIFYRSPEVTTPANWAALGCSRRVSRLPRLIFQPTGFWASAAAWVLGIATNYLAL